jgi:hypothetical protein
MSLIAAMVLPGAAALADDAAAKPAALPQVGVAAAKSLDALDAFAKQLNVPLPPAFTAEGLEAQFTFIGKGGLATDKPIGIAVCGGADLKPDQMMAFVFPMKPFGGTVDGLKALGATPMPDHPDTLLLGSVGLRRTADYLIFSPTPAVAASVNADAIEEAVKGGDALVKVSVDLKSIRQNLPDQYKQMIGGVQADSELEFIAAPTIRMIDSLDRIEAGVSNGEQGVRLALSAAPLKFPTVAAANRPGMPPKVMARLDLGVPVAEAFSSARDLVQILDRNAEASGPAAKPFNDEQKKQINSVFTHFGTLVFEPAAMSVGVEIIAGEPAICIVQRWSKQVDATNEIQQMADTLNSLSNETNPGSKLAFQTYPSDGTIVLRVVAMAGDNPVGALDVAQKGTDVYMTVAPNQFRHIHQLMLANDEGPIKDVLSATIDLGKMVEELSTAKDSPLAGMPPDTVKQILDLLSGHTLGISTSVDGETATLDITASKGLLQDAPKLLAALGMATAQQQEARNEIKVMENVRQLLLGCLSYRTNHAGAWPDNLDAVADSVGGKDALAALLGSTRNGRFVYRKPADANKDTDKTIVIYEGFVSDTPPPKIVAGYADGHVVTIDPAELKSALDDPAGK